MDKVKTFLGIYLAISVFLSLLGLVGSLIHTEPTINTPYFLLFLLGLPWSVFLVRVRTDYPVVLIAASFLNAAIIWVWANHCDENWLPRWRRNANKTKILEKADVTNGKTGNGADTEVKPGASSVP